MKPQIIMTSSGEELVVLSRSEYEALRADAYGEQARDDDDEDAADIALYDARKLALAEGRDAILPPEVAAAMLRGDTLLKALRKWRGTSQTDLAAATELGQGYLSDLEGGRRHGTPETLTKIAAALDIDPAWLLPRGAI